jgi:hypothetical protein
MAGNASRENGKKGGRKKGFPALEAERARLMIAQKLSKDFEPIVNTAIKSAKRGDRYARDWLTDRAYGKAVQAIDLRGKDGKPLFDEETRKKAKQALGQLLGANIGKRGKE